MGFPVLMESLHISRFPNGLLFQNPLFIQHVRQAPAAVAGRDIAWRAAVFLWVGCRHPKPETFLGDFRVSRIHGA